MLRPPPLYNLKPDDPHLSKTYGNSHNGTGVVILTVRRINCLRAFEESTWLICEPVVRRECDAFDSISDLQIVSIVTRSSGIERPMMAPYPSSM